MMDIPPRIIAIAQALLAQNPGLTTGSDDQSRLFVKLVAQQAAFELGPQFGLKAASANRPQGPSQIARQAPDGSLGGWRIVDGDGSASGTKGGIVPNPPFQDFSGQLFISVDPIDHLKVSDQQPPRPDPGSGVSADVARLEQRIDGLERLLRPIADQWSALQDDVTRLDARIDQRYVASKFGIVIVSYPESRVPK
jgi:hypothetical protein